MDVMHLQSRPLRDSNDHILPVRMPQDFKLKLVDGCKYVMKDSSGGDQAERLRILSNQRADL